MLSSIVLGALLAPLGAVAAVLGPYRNATNPTRTLKARQAVITPEPCIPSSVTPEEQSAIWTEYADQLFVQRNLTAAFAHVTSEYLQHNPYAMNGADEALDFLGPIWGSSNVSMTMMHRTFTDGIGMVHYRIDGISPQPEAVVDVLRMNGSCIAEHWDVIQERPLNATNPNAMW